jgi:hypothetical protein
MPEPDTAGPVPSGRSPADGRPVTGWVVWMFFAGAVLVLLGVFQIIDGLVSLFKNDIYSVRPARLPLDVSYTVWGWVHLVLGVALIPLGYAVLAARPWARFTAIGLALLSAVVHFAFIPAYPVWSVVIIALDLIVVYALTIHGGELRMGREHY